MPEICAPPKWLQLLLTEIIVRPKWVLLLLWPFKGEPCYPQIEGDLSEEFQQRESEHGMTAAHRWYQREVCRNLVSLIWRWVTIPVIIVPLLCIVLYSNLLDMRIGSVCLLLHPSGWSIPWRLFDSLLCSSIIGLSLGVICSGILRGHERMVRLAFGAYNLGILVITYLVVGISLSSSHATAFGFWRIYLRPIWVLICIWIGSIWIERHHHSRHKATQ